LKAVKVDPATIVHVWFSNNEHVNTVARAGFKALFSSAWYLDRQVPDPEHTNYLWVDTWKNFYNSDPVGKSNLNPNEEKNILGGGPCMWGEQVDFTVIDSRIWPRASAVGERLWSKRTVTDIHNALDRLISFRCRMVNRGIMASPVAPDYCYVY